MHMPRALQRHWLRTRKPQRNVVPIFAVTLLFAVNFFSVAYINSSYLEKFIDETSVGTIYTVGNAITVLLFLFISRVLHALGGFKLTVGLLLASGAASVGMAFAETLEVAVPLFIVSLIAAPLILFNIDIFMEETNDDDEAATGGRRGLLLALISFISAISPLFGSYLIESTGNDFTLVYLFSAFMTLPIITLLLFFFKDFSDPPYNEIDLFGGIAQFWNNPNIRNVFFAHLALQIFFMFAVVYMPLYLTGHIGLTFVQLGIAIFFGQMAYILTEYPIGVIADKYIGEKEMMGFGFLILTVSIAWISFVTEPSVVIWSVIMFMTRLGASFVEATTESYFFKQTKSSDAQTISFFRVSRPLAYVIGAIVASLSLLYLPFNLLFIVLAALMIPAMFATMNLVDTK